MVLTNEAFLRIFNVTDKKKIIGKYNVLRDFVIEAWWLRPFVEKGPNGEIIQLYDIKASLSKIKQQFGERDFKYDSL